MFHMDKNFPLTPRIPNCRFLSAQMQFQVFYLMYSGYLNILPNMEKVYILLKIWILAGFMEVKKKVIKRTLMKEEI